MGAPATWFDSRGLVLGGSAGEERRLEFYAAEVHYWRLERKDWAGCLAAVRELGFELVSSYVPWGVHEVAPGRHDWSGALDVAGFVDEAARAGLSVLLKPGPHINAELTRFGRRGCRRRRRCFRCHRTRRTRFSARPGTGCARSAR
jgi:beta-galactosidase